MGTGEQSDSENEIDLKNSISKQPPISPPKPQSKFQENTSFNSSQIVIQTGEHSDSEIFDENFDTSSESEEISEKFRQKIEKVQTSILNQLEDDPVSRME